MAWACMVLVTALAITASLAIKKGPSFRETFAEVKSKQVMGLKYQGFAELGEEGAIDDKLMDAPVEELIDELGLELRDGTK